MQVSLLGPVRSIGLGSLGKLVRVRFASAAVVLCVLGLLVSPLHASDTSDTKPSASEAMQAYQQIDSWVRALQVDEDSVGDRAFASVGVTLRLDGQVVGRGESTGFGEDPQRITQATRIAIAQARAWVRQKIGQDPSDEPSSDQWSSIADRLTLSVELAGAVVPMSESSLGLPGLGLSPGVHGLVLRLGEQIEVMGPDEMLTLGLTPERAAYAMATALSSDGGMALASIDELIQRGYTFGRFEPTWIAQGSESRGGVFLDRGGRVVEDSTYGLRSVRDLGQRLARYLIAQQWPGAERYGMVGTRDVVSGRATPQIAPVYEQALSAYALLRYGSSGDQDIHRLAREHGLQLLTDLSIVQPGEPEPWGTQDGGVGAAASAVALSQVKQGLRPDTWNEMEKNCLATLDGLYSPIDGFDASTPAAARGLIAWSMVEAGHRHAEKAVRDVFRDTDAGQLVAQMPFLAWAELGLAEESDDVPAGAALQTMREWMWAHQLGKSDLEFSDRDFVGGVVFTKGSSLLPTSANIRPIAAACLMLGDPRLTEGTIADASMASEIGRVASALRFVDQLTMRADSAFLSRAPDRSIGGIRTSLWELRVSPASSALALISVVDFDESIQAIAARSENP
ncbi:MAG: hypothetical protein JJ974_06665 [Phycisphaerales bacterium]|nr:hypothetical protein [Phycisphaerales bacterium]